MQSPKTIASPATFDDVVFCRNFNALLKQKFNSSSLLNEITTQIESIKVGLDNRLSATLASKTERPPIGHPYNNGIPTDGVSFHLDLRNPNITFWFHLSTEQNTRTGNTNYKFYQIIIFHQYNIQFLLIHIPSSTHKPRTH